ncbi:hypothetical protein Bca52824_059680 [Brassica carinata]|uniref:Uncharacterized protein n=1 Tax=Brassica carinata TaxID=52824 RepID=A0A8X7UEX5_BRACI|nr:hypothetical protein Bca52824_059680 [Brassica carinata]
MKNATPPHHNTADHRNHGRSQLCSLKSFVLLRLFPVFPTFTSSRPLTPLLLVTARSTVQECGFARLSRYYVTVASPSHYAVSSIDGSSQSWICGTSTSLVAGTIVQECKLTKSTSYSITFASSSHYVISHIDGSSQCQLRDLQTGAAIINGGSRMSCSSRTLTHRVFTGVLRPLFFRSRISPSAEALTTSCRLLHMTPLPPLSLVRLVSPSSPIYMARSPSVQATTITPQAVVTTFIFRLERLSTFSGELLESSPRLPPVFHRGIRDITVH